MIPRERGGEGLGCGAVGGERRAAGQGLDETLWGWRAW